MNNKNYSLAWQDIIESIFGGQIWLHLARQEVKLRYRRSVLGPFWITISTGIMVVGMGPLYSYLFKQPVGPYFQYIAVSFVLWNFISSCINESCFSFIYAEGFIKVVKLPYTTYTLKVLAKNFIVFMHNFLIVFVVMFFFPLPSYQYFILFLLGLIVLLLNLFWITLIIGMISLRFRDISQIVASGVQILFFATPIFWKADMLSGHTEYVEWNFLYHLIQIVRAPLLGGFATTLDWLFCLVTLLFGIIFSAFFFAKFRSRISYWV